MNWAEVVKDNPLVALILGLTGVGLSFALGGIIWGFFTLYMCVFAGLVVMSFNRTRRKREAAAQAKPVPRNTASVEITHRVSKPDKQLVDALGALSRSDTARVRAALEAWVGRASSPDERIGRVAQMHYRLFRAGDLTQLGRLKALADAYPNSAEVTLWQRLSTQDHDELWS